MKILLVTGKLFVGFVRAIDPEQQPHYSRDLICSLLLGGLYWVWLFGVVPSLCWWISLPVVVPTIALCAFANELPWLGWDNRIRQLLLEVLLWITTCKAVLGIAFWWVLVLDWEVASPQVYYTIFRTLTSSDTLW